LQLRFLQTKIAANCIPLTTSSVVSIPFASSAVIVPSLPTLSSASAMMSPDRFSLVGGNRCDLSDLLPVVSQFVDVLAQA
jgi:hypothetical protein